MGIPNKEYKSILVDTVVDLPKGVLRVIGRYWQAGKKYKVKIMPTNGMPSKGLTISVIKPSSLGKSYNESVDVYNKPFSLDTMVISNAGKYGIPPQLIKAQIFKEAAKWGGKLTPTYLYEPYTMQFWDLEGISGRFFIQGYNAKYYADVPDHQNVHLEHYFTQPDSVWDIVKNYSQLVYANNGWNEYGKRTSDGKMDFKDLGYKTIQGIYDGIYNNLVTDPSLKNLTQFEIADSARKQMITRLKYHWEGGLKHIIAQTRVASSYGLLQMSYELARDSVNYSIKNLPENMNTNTFFVKCVQYQCNLITKYLKGHGEDLNDNWTKGYYNTFKNRVFKLWHPQQSYPIKVLLRAKSFLPIK
jgi:hypothetical protein